jgi:zinc transporter ZupT
LPTSILVVVLLATAHFASGHVAEFEHKHRRAVLSFGGGISVAYVFLHLLPELSKHQQSIESWAGPPIEHLAYVLALAGLIVFYGLEKMAVRNRPGADRLPKGVFWVHLAAFALYNVLVGYVVAESQSTDLSSTVEFAIAFFLHFLVADIALLDHYQELYRRYARWTLAAAILGGWVLGKTLALDEALVPALFGALSGATVLNALKEEVPADDESHFGAFLAGAVLFSAILLWL